jgi:hypothetical protein
MNYHLSHRIPAFKLYNIYPGLSSGLSINRSSYLFKMECTFERNDEIVLLSFGGR